jgi:hypothetical protein
MVVALEAIFMGGIFLALVNDSLSGFAIKSLVSLLIPGATVGLIFLPKVAIVYNWGHTAQDSNPWRFVKGGSSGSNNSKSKHENDPKSDDSKISKKAVGIISPSLNSLVSGKVLVSNDTNRNSNRQNPLVHPNAVHVSFHCSAQNRFEQRPNSKEIPPVFTNFKNG